MPLPAGTVRAGLVALLLTGCGGVTLDPVGMTGVMDDGGAREEALDGGVSTRDTGAPGSGGAGGAATDGGSDSGGNSAVTDTGAPPDGGRAAPVDGGAPDSRAPIVAKQVVTGERHTCVLFTDGAVKCWGGSPYGQLGYGNKDSIGDDEPPSSVGFVSITNDPGVTVIELAAGWQHTCALLSNGTVKCWGWNDQGQLGYGNTDSIGDDELPSSVGPVSVTTEAGVTVTQITAGRHTCALLSNGIVRCWGAWPLGYGDKNSIGDDELPSSARPISVTESPGITVLKLVAGFYHTCALLSDQTMKCWGENGYGQLGLGNVDAIGDDELPSTVGPVSLTTVPGVAPVDVAGGFFHTCALLSSGSVDCWGAGSNGAGSIGYGNGLVIGDDELPSSAGPVSITTASNVTTTAIGGGVHHACALLSDRTVKCWGESLHGQLGYGNEATIGDDELPSSVGSVSITTSPGVHVTALASGNSNYHTCVTLSDGSVKCWGFNAEGELGLGTTGDVGDDELPSSVGSAVMF